MTLYLVFLRLTRIENYDTVACRQNESDGVQFLKDSLKMVAMDKYYVQSRVVNITTSVQEIVRLLILAST